MAERWFPAWALAAVAFGGASLIVPLYVVELGGDAFLLGILFASASFVGVPGALVFGNLADRTGRRRVFVLTAIGVTVISMGLIPLLDRIAFVIAANALLWLSFAAAVPVLNLLVVSDEPPERWSELIARLNKFQGIGWALGLALGFVIITVGGQVVEPITAQRIFFVSCAILAGIGFLLARRTLPPDLPTGDEPSRRRLQQAARRAARFNIRGAAFPFTPTRFDPRNLHHRQIIERFSPRLVTLFAAVFIVFTGFGIFFAPLPAYMTDGGFSAGDIFALYLILNVGAAVFFGRSAALAEQYNLVEVLTGGLLARGVLFPLVPIAIAILGGTMFGFGIVSVFFFVIGTTWAIVAVMATTLVSTLSPDAMRGEALGIYGGLGAVGGGVGGIVGGYLAGFGYFLTFVIAGTTVLLGALLVYQLIEKDDTAATTSTTSHRA